MKKFYCYIAGSVYRWKIRHIELLAIFYWFDCNHNRHSNLKQMRSGMKNHYMLTIEMVKKYTGLVKGKNYCSLADYKGVLKALTEDGKVDPIEQIFRVRELPELDRSIPLMTDSLANFSDISSRNAAQQADALRQQGAEQHWSAAYLDLQLRALWQAAEVAQAGRVLW
ncbi:hypothetical protein SS50377_27830 [Spironucleus salmonicida]|uniref:Uncharacterized protein n=1 Tax=Spironucleus salmonicida TaxID=348837 RepID=A0A9P8LKQ1_9EUKA|nr:hypothetical protein SS50377_27830 [Spironucleus salmonicida]